MDGLQKIKMTKSFNLNILSQNLKLKVVNFPNLRNISDAYGFKYYCIKSNLKFKEDLNKIWNNISQPTLLEVNIRENIESFPKLSPKMNPDGSITSGSLIDCSPSNENFYKVLEKKIYLK